MKSNGDNFWNPCTVTKKELCNSSQDENRFISRALMGWCLLIKNMWQIVLAKKGLDMKCQTGLHPLALIKLSERYRDTEKKSLIREIICSFILQTKNRGNKAGLYTKINCYFVKKWRHCVTWNWLMICAVYPETIGTKSAQKRPYNSSPFGSFYDNHRYGWTVRWNRYMSSAERQPFHKFQSRSVSHFGSRYFFYVRIMLLKFDHFWYKTDILLQLIIPLIIGKAKSNARHIFGGRDEGGKFTTSPNFHL